MNLLIRIMEVSLGYMEELLKKAKGDKNMRTKVTAIALAVLMGTSTIFGTQSTVFAQETNLEQSALSDAKMTTYASTDVVNFPDAAFKKLITKQLGLPEGSDVTKADMEKITGISIIGLEHITDITGIENAVNLTSLTILTDVKGIENIGGLSKLQDITFWEVNSFTFDMLGAMPELKSFDGLYADSVTSLDGITAEKFPALERLECSRFENLSDISALKNQELPNLKYLDLEGVNKITDITPLKGYASLRELRLEKVDIDKQTDRAAYKDTISSLTGLTKLYMPYCDLTDDDTDMFASLQNLTSLVLNQNDITKTDFCDKLPGGMQVLGLYGNDIKNMDNLTRFKDLTILGLGYNEVTDFQFLNELPKLTKKTIRNAEGEEKYPAVESLNIGSYMSPDVIDGSKSYDNPYVGMDGKPISLADATIETTECKVTYDAAKNKIVVSDFTDSSGDFTISKKIVFTLGSGDEKVMELRINGYVKQLIKYKVTYDWGAEVPEGVVLPVDKNTYTTETDAMKAKDTKYTGNTEVQGEVDGLKGTWQFSGWTSNTQDKTVKFTGKWNFLPEQLAINACPVITAEDLALSVGDKFDPLAGVKATDKEDGEIELSKENIIENNVDLSKEGTYNITYKVTDSEGASVEKTIAVVVNPKMEELNSVPTINATDKELTVGDEFNPLDGVVAQDKEDGEIELSKENIIENNVDLSRAGTYKITYKVTDSKGASIAKTITITVKEKATMPESKPESEPTIPNQNDSKPETPNQNESKSGSPQTGDAAQTGLFVSLFGVAGLMVIGLGSKKRKNQK